jgi:DHA1 family multidrug resistance protein-like MFS transporter
MVGSDRSLLMERWQRTLWLMVGLQTAMATSFSISGPFLPLLIAELGVHPMSAVETWSGIASSIYALPAALVSPFWGVLADRTGRKAMVVRTCIAASLINGATGLAQNEWQLTGIQVVAGLFGGFTAAAMALVGTQVPEDRLGYSLGWVATGQLVGTLIGPLIGGVLADAIHDYRVVYFVTSAGALVCALGCAAFVREHEGRPALATGRSPEPFWQQLGALRAHTALLPLFTVVMLAQFTARGAQPIIPLFVQELAGNVPWIATAAGAAIALTGVAGIIGSPLLGKRGDEYGYRNVLLISLAGGALFTLPQGLATSIWVFLALRFVVGLFLGGILPSANAWIGRAFPRERRGQIYGITASASFLGIFFGPLTGGLTAAHFGFKAVFIEIGVLMLVNLVCVALIKSEQSPPQPEPASR